MLQPSHYSNSILDEDEITVNHSGTLKNRLLAIFNKAVNALKRASLPTASIAGGQYLFDSGQEIMGVSLAAIGVGGFLIRCFKSDNNSQEPNIPPSPPTHTPS